jgi:hypothetical protein
MTGDIFEEHESRSALCDDPPDLWPQVSRIVLSSAIAGD